MCTFVGFYITKQLALTLVVARSTVIQLHMQGSGTSQPVGGKVTRAVVRRVVGRQHQKLHLEKPMFMFYCC